MFGRAGTAGIFSGGDAIETLYECTQSGTSAQGVAYDLTCDMCGTKQRIIIGWQQMVDMAMAPQTHKVPVDPETGRPWVLDNGRLYPELGCCNCQKQIKLAFTPDEGARVVQQGLAQGFIRR